jgi:hypothetical protein
MVASYLEIRASLSDRYTVDVLNPVTSMWPRENVRNTGKGGKDRTGVISVNSKP